MAQSFDGAIDAWVLQTKQRVEAVVKNAGEFVVEDVIERTPVDTGFLRATLIASLDGPQPLDKAIPDGTPPGLSKKGGKRSFEDPTQYDLVINAAELGQTIYVSFTANYAAHVEYGANGRAGMGMVRLAVQAWPQHVARAVQEAKAAVASRSR